MDDALGDQDDSRKALYPPTELCTGARRRQGREIVQGQCSPLLDIHTPTVLLSSNWTDPNPLYKCYIQGKLEKQTCNTVLQASIIRSTITLGLQ